MQLITQKRAYPATQYCTAQLYKLVALQNKNDYMLHLHRVNKLCYISSVPRKCALFFHRLSILERATDHECINNCSYPKEIWVGFKCNGPVNFFSERRYFKYNTCNFPPCLPPPPTKLHLLSLATPPLSPQAPLLSGGRDIFGSGAPTGVLSPEKGDPSNMTGEAGIFDGSEPWENSVGAQETGDDQQRLPPSPPRLSWCPWSGTGDK